MHIAGQAVELGNNERRAPDLALLQRRLQARALHLPAALHFHKLRDICPRPEMKPDTETRCASMPKPAAPCLSVETLKYATKSVMLPLFFS
ncbi:MAG TPA: hypothetical protein VKU00_14020 [Chthonomonadaceae bacterium]|nr:hypothetical protein [Chthonomonadaceae bacterium]